MNLKQVIRQWLGDGWTLWAILFLLLLNGAGWVAIAALAPRNLDVSPLHYTIYFGINLTGHWLELFWLPAIGLAAIVSHSIIARLVHHQLWVRLWLVLAMVINVMMLIDLTAMLILLRTSIF